MISGSSGLLSGPVIADDIWGFHAQQAVEKLLKSAIAHREHQFTFTHNLFQLVDLAEEYRLTLPPVVEDLVELTPFAAELRYSYSQPHGEQKLARDSVLKQIEVLQVWVADLLRVDV